MVNSELLSSTEITRRDLNFSDRTRRRRRRYQVNLSCTSVDKMGHVSAQWAVGTGDFLVTVKWRAQGTWDGTLV